jgi:histone acetyltransferase 1
MAESSHDAQAGECKASVLLAVCTGTDCESGSTSANDAVTISLCAATKDGPKPFKSFPPQFTYSIFGDDEQIFGYKGLKVNLRYRAHDMRPHLAVTYIRKFDTVGDTEATDVKEVLRKHLPPVAFSTDADFVDSSKLAKAEWTPPGTLHKTIEDATGTYEIWKGTLDDPAVKQLVNRVQIMIPMYIEGGTYIGAPDSLEDDDRWTVFFLFKKEMADPTNLSPYVFVGYSTIYRFFYLTRRQQPTPSPAPGEREDIDLPLNGNFDLTKLPCRSRLSQFLVLPAFQGQGNGARLYKTIFEYYQNHAETKELTVEDPNEAFDLLRDLCDLEYVSRLPGFEDLHLDATYQKPKTGTIPNTIVEPARLETLRTQTKIAPRQFARVVEMYLMSKLPSSVRPRLPTSTTPRPRPTSADKHLLELWELFVKIRLYIRNKDTLGQLEKEERTEKIEETLSSVEFEYADILSRFEGRKGKNGEAPAEGLTANGKRKADDESEAGESATKKARVEHV